MNVFEEVKNINRSNEEKIALLIRLKDGSQRSYNYRQMFEAVTLFYTILENMKVKEGDRIAIIAESCPEWTIAYLAIAKMNATAVLLDATLGAGELLELLEKTEVRGIFASPKAIEKLGVVSKAPIFNILNLQDANLQCQSVCASAAMMEGDKNVSSIIFSSGTTKKASGVMHSHESLIESTKMCIKSNKLCTTDRFLAVLPNSHIYGVVCQILGPLLLGAPTCFLEDLNASGLVGGFQGFKPTIFPAVPKIYEMLKSQILQKINSDPKTKKMFTIAFPICLKLRKTTGINLGIKLFKAIHDNFGGQLRILCSAGAPLGAETAAFFYGIGFDMLITYGATETCIPTIGNCTGNITTDTCGLPYPAITVKISDGGEILLKTPYLMLGYFKDEQATADACDDDGWFRSGDLGRLDEKGRVIILGRCKENIILATGKKVAPDDIESSYSGVRGMKELVVCGIPVADGSHDEVHAFVVPEGTETESILKQLKARSAELPQNQKLTGIHFVDAIPKTSLQKPKRFLLRQMIPKIKETTITTETECEATDIQAVICAAIARVSKANIADFGMSTRLFEELAIDSLSALELAYEIEERCGTRIEHKLDRSMTVAQLIECAASPDQGDIMDKGEEYPKVKHRMEYNLFCLVRYLFGSIYRVKVENDGILPEKGGYIICANHVSHFDYLYLTATFKRERFTKFCCMAKKELFRKNWFSKKIASICGMVPVDRSGLVAEAMASIREKLRENWGVLIHPEGTRSGTGQLGAFKNGAAVLAIEAGVPIVPAYINGGYEIYPRWRKRPQLFNWKKMSKYHVEVTYGDPIWPKGLSAEELMKSTEAAVTFLSRK